jgi:hypothetical protein
VGSSGKTGIREGLGGSRISSDFGSEAGSIGGSEESGRVRKRDMVANAVTGGLASGLGWVLGKLLSHFSLGAVEEALVACFELHIV